MSRPQGVPAVEVIFEIHPTENVLENNIESVAFEELRRELQWQHSNLSYELRERLQERLIEVQAGAAESQGSPLPPIRPQRILPRADEVDEPTLTRTAVLNLQEEPVIAGRAFLVGTDFPQLGIDRQDGPTGAPAAHPYGQPAPYQPFVSKPTPVFEENDLDQTQRPSAGDERRFRCVRLGP